MEVTPGERFTIRTSSAATNGAYLALEVIADPQNGVPMHVHDNEEEHFIIVEGTARIANGDRTLDLPTGSMTTVGRGVPHAWCNLASMPLRMLVVFTPGQIEELFVAVSKRARDSDIGLLASAHGTRIVGPPLLEGIYTTFSPRPHAS
jgi:mannose-6-phosphate isomerase-like protein (cupin superfamily)